MRPFLGLAHSRFIVVKDGIGTCVYVGRSHWHSTGTPDLGTQVRIRTAASHICDVSFIWTHLDLRKHQTALAYVSLRKHQLCSVNVGVRVNVRVEVRGYTYIPGALELEGGLT